VLVPRLDTELYSWLPNTVCPLLLWSAFSPFAVCISMQLNARKSGIDPACHISPVYEPRDWLGKLTYLVLTQRPARSDVVRAFQQPD